MPAISTFTGDRHSHTSHSSARDERFMNRSLIHSPPIKSLKTLHSSHRWLKHLELFDATARHNRKTRLHFMQYWNCSHSPVRKSSFEKRGRKARDSLRTLEKSLSTKINIATRAEFYFLLSWFFGNGHDYSQANCANNSRARVTVKDPVRGRRRSGNSEPCAMDSAMRVWLLAGHRPSSLFINRIRN